MSETSQYLLDWCKETLSARKNEIHSLWDAYLFLDNEREEDFGANIIMDFFMSCGVTAQEIIDEWKDNYLGVELFAWCDINSSIVIPEKIQTIEPACFYNSTLSDIQIDHPIEIYNNAFMGCKNLRMLALPPGTTHFSWSAISNCPDLTLSLPESLVKKWFNFKPGNESLAILNWLSNSGIDIYDVQIRDNE